MALMLWLNSVLILFPQLQSGVWKTPALELEGANIFFSFNTPYRVYLWWKWGRLVLPMSLAWKNRGMQMCEGRASQRCMCLWANTERFLDITWSIPGEMCVEAQLSDHASLQCLRSYWPQACQFLCQQFNLLSSHPKNSCSFCWVGKSQHQTCLMWTHLSNCLSWSPTASPEQCLPCLAPKSGRCIPRRGEERMMWTIKTPGLMFTHQN